MIKKAKSIIASLIFSAVVLGGTNIHANIKKTTSTTEVLPILQYGAISPNTGRPATNYVSPHYRSNGTYVNGYYRS